MPHKDVRTIIKAGETSFAVIIPRGWLRFYNLKNGDKVSVLSNGKITIEPLPSEEKQNK